MCRSRRAAGAFAVASLVATATLAAQGLRPRFGVAAGMAVPTGAYHSAASGEGINSGWQGTALVTLTVPGWPEGLRMDGTYSTHRANDQLKADLTASIVHPTYDKPNLRRVHADAPSPP